jgi:uncharacterized coiled-coil DUF342 family protein
LKLEEATKVDALQDQLAAAKAESAEATDTANDLQKELAEKKQQLLLANEEADALKSEKIEATTKIATLQKQLSERPLKERRGVHTRFHHHDE